MLSSAPPPPPRGQIGGQRHAVKVPQLFLLMRWWLTTRMACCCGRWGRSGFSQSYHHGWHDVSQPHYGPCEVLAFTDATGATFMLILPMLLHHPLRALCRSVEKNTDSLVKGMILFDQGGRGRGGEKSHDQKRSPPSVRGPLAFCCCLHEGFFLIFLRAQKYWRETHLLDPLQQNPKI